MQVLAHVSPTSQHTWVLPHTAPLLGSVSTINCLFGGTVPQWHWPYTQSVIGPIKILLHTHFSGGPVFSASFPHFTMAWCPCPSSKGTMSYSKVPSSHFPPYLQFQGPPLNLPSVTSAALNSTDASSFSPNLPSPTWYHHLLGRCSSISSVGPSFWPFYFYFLLAILKGGRSQESVVFPHQTHTPCGGLSTPATSLSISTSMILEPLSLVPASCSPELQIHFPT